MDVVDPSALIALHGMHEQYLTSRRRLGFMVEVGPVPRGVARAALASAAALSRTLRSREAVVRMPSSPKPMIRRPACKQRHFSCFLLILDFSTQPPAPAPAQPVVVGPYMSNFEHVTLPY